MNMGAGGRKHHDISARDFKTPLLTVLGDLTDSTADVAVRYKDTWAPICGSMGITLDQYGEVENGKTQVQTWIGWAFRHLKDEGLGIGKGRGKWALTQSGVEAYKALQAGGPKAKTPVAAIAAKDDDSASAEPVATVPTIGVAYAVGPGQADDGYHADPYIRALAVSSTKCFGGFTPRSSICGTCPLSGPCQNLVAAELSALAGQLAHEDEQAALAKLAKPESAPKAQKAAQAPKAQAKPVSAYSKDDAEALIAHVESKCGHCGETIEQGSNCWWIRTQGDRKGVLLHEGCL
jgi:hypothetical protein